MKFILTLIILNFISLKFNQVYPQLPVKIIFDTDMGPDYDDVGAIAILHALASKGECEILACCASDGHPAIAPTIEAFNIYFGKADIPIGIPGKDAPGFTAKNNWNDSIVTRFLPVHKRHKNYPPAVEVYRKVLAAQKDQSLTIITVGFVSNLHDLLKSGPDKISPLPGVELVKKKVKIWVAMAGVFPEGSEFNVNKDSKASYYTFSNWPTPILFSGWEIGSRLFTGKKVAQSGSADNPVSWAYKYNLATYEKTRAEKRQSWDQTAVLCAVRKPEKYFYVNGPGKFIIYENGRNSWDPETNANHYFISHKYPFNHMEGIIDDLMLYEPKK